jgi:predicted membrane-bound spermidine synthase
LLSVVALAGAGTMTVELAAVRLLAPWFGASSGVWTNVIGVILLALAVGYRLGARFARREDPRRNLSRALLVAAAAAAWLPFLARPVAELFLPAGLALDEAAELLLWGSLAAALVLFLPAALVLGVVGPLSVEVLQREHGGHAGEAGGRVLAASTIGSLAGTFGTTHVFLPSLGLRWTFLATSLALALAAVLVAARRPRVVAEGAAAALVWIAALAWGALGAPSLAGGTSLLAARESAYQSLRVLETEDARGPMRRLAINEGLDSFQSVWQPEKGLLRPGYYYNSFALPPWWQGASGSWRLLVLGLGAGTSVRVLEGSLPAGCTLDSTGVEIDPAVVELATRWFDLERGPGRRVLGGLDARSFLRGSSERWQQIVVDAYANNMEIPAHLSSVEFFGLVRAHLEAGGWLVVNVAGFGLVDPVVEAVAGTLARAFEKPVLGTRVPFARNCVLYVRESGEMLDPEQAGWVVGSGALATLADSLRLPGSWRWYAPAADPLDDDRNPIERLQRESVRRGREHWLKEG